MTQPIRSIWTTVAFWLFLVGAFAFNLRASHQRDAEELRRHNEILGLLQAIAEKR